MKQTKVALVMCPSWGREAPPLSISLLGAITRNDGFETSIIDLNNELFHLADEDLKIRWAEENYGDWNEREKVEELFSQSPGLLDYAVERILKEDVDILGFSILFSTIHASLIVAEKVKQLNPRVKIMVGGAHASKNYACDYLIGHSFIDAVVQHEGDVTILELLNCYEGSGVLRADQGVTYRDGVDVVDTPRRAELKSISDLPFSDYSDFKLATYKNPDRLDIFSSRSCVLRCHYCDEATYYNKYRARTGKSLYDEVVFQIARNPQVSYFNFSDSVLNGNMAELKDFCARIISGGVGRLLSGKK